MINMLKYTRTRTNVWTSYEDMYGNTLAFVTDCSLGTWILFTRHITVNGQDVSIMLDGKDSRQRAEDAVTVTLLGKGYSR
jgi:hypothetical protein